MTDRPAQIEAENTLETPYNAADPKQVNAARKKDARLRRARLNVVASLMDLKEGRAWMHETLAFCHIFQSPFFQGDPHSTSFRCGEHNVGLRLLADVMAAAPNKYVVMCEEAAGRV